MPFSVPFCPSFHPFFPPVHSFFCLSFLPADSPAFFPFVHPFLSLSSLTSLHSYLYIPIIYQIHTFIVDKTDQQQQIPIWGLLCFHLYFPPSVPCPLDMCCHPDGGTWGQLKGLFLLLQEQLHPHHAEHTWSEEGLIFMQTQVLCYSARPLPQFPVNVLCDSLTALPLSLSTVLFLQHL